MSLRRELRAASGFAFGSVAVFLAFVYRGEALVAPFAILAALLLVGAVLAIRERPRSASRRRRWGRRGLTTVAAVAVLLYVVAPLAAAVWLTQAPRESVRAFSLPHEEVTLRTSDGLALAGWYVPSRNGAAVVVVHGGGGTRNGSESHARMLAAAGYGVLLYDARGNGESEGDHDAMGWTWREDVDAAVAYLHGRPDVHRGIGALGLSTGAEAVLDAAAGDETIAAVVADGAIARNLAETRQLEGLEEAQALPYYGLVFATLRLITGAPQPPPLQEQIPRIAPRPVLLISAGTAAERTMNRAYRRAAPKAVLWELPAVGHTQAIHERPGAYRQRVVGWFDRALLD